MQQHNLKVDAGMRSKTRSDARGKYRDEPSPNTGTVANRAGKTESGEWPIVRGRRFANLVNPVRAHCSLFLLLDLSARHSHRKHLICSQLASEWPVEWPTVFRIRGTILALRPEAIRPPSLQCQRRIVPA